MKPMHKRTKPGASRTGQRTLFNLPLVGSEVPMNWKMRAPAADASHVPKNKSFPKGLAGIKKQRGPSTFLVPEHPLNKFGGSTFVKVIRFPNSTSRSIALVHTDVRGIVRKVDVQHYDAAGKVVRGR